MSRRGRPPTPVAPVPRRQPRDASSTGTVEAILIAAERVLAERGGAGLTTNRVAEVAGVSVGSLYQYFPNKEALVRALHERYLAQFIAVVPRVLAGGVGLTVDELARRIADGYVDVYQAQAPIHRWLWQMRSAADLHEVIDRELSRMVELAASTLLAFGLASGEQARVLGFVLVHSVDGLANAISFQGDDLDARAAARTFAEMVACYLVARRPVTPAAAR